MKKSMRFSDKTKELAFEKALRELNLTEDDVTYDIIQLPTKGFLGLGVQPCIIEVSFEGAEEEVAPLPVAKVEKKATSAPKKEKEEPKIEKRAPSAPKNEQEAKVVEKREKKERIPAIISKEKEEKAIAFVKDVTEKMGAKLNINVSVEENNLKINLTGEDIGIVIGRRGETLDSLQYLTSLIINKDEDDYIKVTIDTENYRQKREETLVRLANKLATKVIKYNRNISLEPMNPYERRIIHSALQEFKGVTTHSTGTEPNRKVVIAPDGVKAKERPVNRQPLRPNTNTKESVMKEKAAPAFKAAQPVREAAASGVTAAQAPATQAGNYKPRAVAGEKLARAKTEE